ncbi:ANR family transcriptional regulator [Xenorhabdus sp. SGI246]|uniref:ANR family transcriptional regulator n=1 Tax=Xenorhabdus sp. SGI246 TaxID=3158263 RepID=UPI00349F35CA
MKESRYIEAANKAILQEKKKDFKRAAGYWEIAKIASLNINNQRWAEYRQEHNEKRHALHNKYKKIKDKNEDKRIASELKKHVNKKGGE